MKRILSFILLFAVSVLAAVLNPQLSTAAFNQNNIMSDSVFSNANSMNASQIDAFLNSFPSSCISTNRGFSSQNVVGYNPSQGFLYGADTPEARVSAGTVIHNAAQAYGLNPQVILATLQKEQSLVTGTAGCHYSTPPEQNPCPNPPYGTSQSCVTACQYAGGCVYIAMGYDCPYYCVPNSTGFSKQIIKATWKLKFVQERSLGNYNWNVQKPGWDNSDDPLTSYDGYMTAGNLKRNANSPTLSYDGLRPVNNNSLTVLLGSGATASLYSFTPFTSGNTNFVNIFESWFGSTQTNNPWAWAYEGQWEYVDSGRSQQFSSVATTTPGGKVYVRVKARNMGNQTWDQSFTHMAASRPMDTPSPLAEAGWVSNSRAAKMLESSVAPGQLATFEFALQAPAQPGTYSQYFNIVAEGRSWLNDLGLVFTINVNEARAENAPNDNVLESGETLNKDDYLLSKDGNSVFTIQNDGNIVLYSNFKPSWSLWMPTSANRITMQPDGNLVMYNPSNQAVWSSQTQGNPGARLIVQTDGNLVIYNASNAPVWNSGTVHTPDHLSYINTTLHTGRLYPGQRIQTANGQYMLILQPDSNMVLYSPNRPIWASGTDGRNVAFAAMQGDGNFVIYDKQQRPIWYTRTDGRGTVRGIMQSDGNFVMYNSQNVPVWHTVTSGVQ